ncbi:MAG: GNAT family N-acetyltransferase [Verrucomicrobiota bacterium]|nr:GNAT family N-acetyltransferase [Verrucomicrobiota bacterium]
MNDRRHGVLILYNKPRSEGPDGRFRESDASVIEEVKVVARALSDLRVPHREVGVTELAELNRALLNAPEKIVFNLVECFYRNSEDACLVPALCRACGKGFTGTDTPGLLLRLDKWHAKAILRARGLPCPAGRLVPQDVEPDLAGLFPGPYIVKPARADASEGIDNASVIPAPGPALLDAVRRLHAQMGQPAIIEQFVDGRELNVSILWHEGVPTVLPLAEIEFVGFDASRPKIVGYAAKWLTDSFEYRNTRCLIPAPLAPELAERVRDLVIRAAGSIGCSDYARVDLRLDPQGRPFILEVNTNPDLSPDAGFPTVLAAAGMTFAEFVDRILRNAARRYRRNHTEYAIEATVPHEENAESAGDRIRWSRPEDRAPILRMLEETRFFRPDELLVAREVLDDALLKGPAGHYQSYVAEKDGQAVGWVSFGPVPCALGSYEVYWIVVSPSCRRVGVGGKLMDRVERAVARRKGRQILIETSGQAVYEPTRSFYAGLGYRQIAYLTDFYAPGDNMIVFAKTMSDPAVTPAGV